jgi:hypothetical protein
MKIGLDMDNTICSTSEKVTEYEEIFIKDNNIDSYTLWHNNYYTNSFLNEYLEKIYTEVEPKPNAITCISKLKEQGHKIYIITARSNNYVKDMYKLINNYFKEYNIKIDGIFINSKDKVDVCIDNNINIMVDDNFHNYDMLTSNNIETILYDEYNEYPYIKRRILSWKELNKAIKNTNYDN